MTDTAGDLSHLDAAGHPRMVDIGEKQVTPRRAVAEGRVRIGAALVEAIRNCDVAKGSVLDVARLAGIQAAKRTDELIPLCHSLPLESVSVDATLEADGIHLRAEVRTTWKTGVEMEALTAVAVAALTVVDMGKAIDKGIVIEQIRLVSKSGGRHGDYTASQDPTS